MLKRKFFMFVKPSGYHMKGKARRVLLIIFILIFSSVHFFPVTVKAVAEEPKVILGFDDGYSYSIWLTYNYWFCG